MGRWQAVVFDLDDTLFPERDYVLSGFRAVAAWAQAHLDIPAEVGFLELGNLFAQGVRGDTFDRWLALHSLEPDELVPTLVHVYRGHRPILAPYAEVPGVLAALRRHYRLGLVSDGPLAVQQAKLHALGLGACFDAIVFCDQWGPEAWKPSTRPFRVALRRLQVSPSQAVYVGDNPIKDFIGARRAGLASVRIQRPTGEYGAQVPPTPEHAPDLTIGSLTELEQALEDLEEHVDHPNVFT